jgi:hypothetical protein
VTLTGWVQAKPSINDTLADAHHALTFEKVHETAFIKLVNPPDDHFTSKQHQPQLLSSSLFGLYDIYGKLKTYKATLIEAYGEMSVELLTSASLYRELTFSSQPALVLCQDGHQGCFRYAQPGKAPRSGSRRPATGEAQSWVPS